jgi:cobalt-zinc-cadmium efflux system membrane fusion protein
MTFFQGLKAARAIGAALLLAGSSIPSQVSAQTAFAVEPAVSSGPEPAVELTDTQLASMKIEPVRAHLFPREKQAVGNIDFNQELVTQVFTPYQGRIIKAFVRVGDEVKKDQVLFTIDSPDLVQAESTLISAAGVLEFNSKNLQRYSNLVKQSAVAQKDYEQAFSDNQAAVGALRAARAAVKVFGKSDAEIDKIVADRKIDPALVVPSPMDGRITSRNAAPGLLVQPGNPPPVYTVADISTMWMLANVPEKDIPDLKEGDGVRVNVDPYPRREFTGKITTIGDTVDPVTRRVLVRSEINDPNHELRAGMFATFVITIAPPNRAPAVSQDAIIREGDGTMTVWVTADRHRFVKRIVKTGLTHGGFTEILDGLRIGEFVATDGSLFIANQFTNASR